MKCLIICFDALDYNFCRELKIFEDFNILKMISEVPLTGSAWTTLYTGVPENVHGVKSVDGVIDTGASKSFKSCESKFFWDYMPELRCELFALPVTYPPKKIKGYMVSGDIIPGYEFTFTEPRQLKNKLENYYIDIWHYLNEKGFEIKRQERMKRIKEYQRQQLEGNSDDLYSGFLKAYTDINNGITRNFINFHKSTDLCGVGFTFIDRVEHWAPIHTDKVRAWYLEVKKIVDKLIMAIQPENIFIISDHGRPTQMQPPEMKHKRDGVFIYTGADLKRATFEECSQLDFLPTLLRMYGVRKPENLTGNILDIFKSEKELINEKLRGIGYE